MRKSVNLSVGIQWLDPDQEKIATHTELLLKQLEISPFKENLPLYWIIPSHPFLESKNKTTASLLLKIKTRISTLQEIPVATGYSGALYPLLTPDELKQELDWSLTNPWHSGMLDYFKESPEILVPRVIGAQTPEASEWFAARGFKLIGGSHHFLRPQANNFIPCLELAPGQPLPVLNKNLRKLVAGKNDFFLILFPLYASWDSSTLKDAWNNLSKAMLKLQRKYNLVFRRPDERGNMTVNNPAATRAFCLENSLMTRCRFLAVDKYRKKSSLQAKDYKNILELLQAPQSELLASPDLNGISPPAFPPEDRINNCTMQGNTILAGAVFSAIFNNGRLTNIADKNGHPLLCDNHAAAYLTIGKNCYQFENISAASVGGKHTRGLRELLKLEPPECLQMGSQLTDYIFYDDFPYLMVSTRIRYPSFPQETLLTNFVPFEFPLFQLGKEESLEVTTLGPRFTIRHILLPREEEQTLLGSLFVISRKGTNLIIGFPPEKNETCGIVTLKITPRKYGAMVTLALCSTYRQVPAKTYNKSTEFFSFYLGVEETLPTDLPYFPAKVLKEIPYHCIIRE